MTTQNEKARSMSGKRWRLLGGLLAGVLVIGLGYTRTGRRCCAITSSTDDAYVERQRRADHAADLGHRRRHRRRRYAVRARPARRWCSSTRPTPKSRSTQAEAQLARTVRDVRNLFATSAQLQAAVQRAPDRISSAAQAILRAAQRLGSFRGGVRRGAAARARRSQGAQAALLAAQQQLAANRARVDSTTLENHPQVRDAAAQCAMPTSRYARTELPAPVAGFVARRNVQLGQRVRPGRALMAVVPLDQVWVDANFKEPQLADMRVGQPVTLTADLYGGSRLPRQGGGPRRRHRRGVLAAAGAERDRQLDQDRAARAGTHCARSARARRAPAADRSVDEGRRRHA